MFEPLGGGVLTHEARVKLALQPPLPLMYWPKFWGAFGLVCRWPPKFVSREFGSPELGHTGFPATPPPARAESRASDLILCFSQNLSADAEAAAATQAIVAEFNSRLQRGTDREMLSASPTHCNSPIALVPLTYTFGAPLKFSNLLSCLILMGHQDL